MNQAPTIDFGAPIAAAIGAGLLRDLVTIHDVNETVSNSGAQVLALGSAVSGLTGLACQIGYNLLRSRVQRSEEERAEDRTKTVDELHCLIGGYYPAITKQQRAVTTRGAVVETWDIQGIDHDSSRTMTTLTIVKVEL